MLAIEMKNISKYYGVNKIFNNISFQVNEKEKVGFVGQNGCGKTTLFKIITGKEDYKDGCMTIKKGLSAGYLDQIPNYEEGLSVRGVLDFAFCDVQKLESNMKKLEHDMSVFTGKELENAMKEYADTQHMFEIKGGYNIEENISRVSNGLGFSNEFLTNEFSKLSGGEKTKVILAKILLEAPDILLLDEPTNHLDIEAVEWLEEFIKSYMGTVLIISHDRYFLDRVIDKIIEIEDGESETYCGNYTFYTEEKDRKLLAELVMYNNQQREIKSMEDAVRRFKDWGSRADNPAMFKKMHNMEKRLDKMDRIDKPKLEHKKMKLAFSTADRTGDEVLDIMEYSKAFNEKNLFKSANLKIYHGESAAIIGSNGCGKSTIIKSVLKEYIDGQNTRLSAGQIRYFLEQIHVKDLDSYKKDEGIIKFGTNMKLAYLDQNIGFPNEDCTVLEAFRDNLYIDEQNARNVLAKFLFRNDDVFKKVKDLSGGEKTRLRLCQLIQQNINFLVLDEPTNHLDIDSKQVLEQALLDFEGTMLFISHDRYFINKLANKVFEVKDKSIKCYEGNYDYYRSEKSKQRAVIVEVVIKEKEKVQKDKQSYQDKVEERAKVKRKQTLEEKIYKFENSLKEIDKRLDENGNNYDKLTEIMQERWQIQQELENLYEEWGKCN